jgi:hypothetical protein
MIAPTPKCISVTANPTFWEVFVASLVLLGYRWQLTILHAVFPLAGMFLLLAPFITGNRLGVGEVLVALLAFSFTPLVTAFKVWSARRRNKLAQGPFTYSFDADGMHTSGATFSQTILWAAIPRIRRSQRFVFIFIAPARALCIPVRAIKDPQFFDDLRSLARGRTDFGPDTGGMSDKEDTRTAAG